MQHSAKPYEELELASDLIESMKRANTLVELEAYWKRYLHHLDRVWNKAQAHFSKSPKWSGWHGKYAKLRKNDQLLNYFVGARNADEHSISEITEKLPAAWEITPVSPGEQLNIKSMRIVCGNIEHLDTDTPFKIAFFASRIGLLPAVNRGITYPVPGEHLGKAIIPYDLIGLAERGVLFYKSFLKEAEEKFVE